MVRITHGRSGTRAHSIWMGMRQRCGNANNPHFASYGGRGIRVCERWQRFENFLADMGEPEPKMTLDRIANDGHYEPGNCRWASRRVQMNNRRVCRYFTVNGEARTLSEWSRISGIHRNTIEQRMRAGEPIEDAIKPGRRTDLAQVLAAAQKSSIARKARTHCKNGHEWTPENTAMQKTGRYCRACNREKAQRLAASR